MRRNPPTPLTPNEQEALSLLEDRVATSEEALAHKVAIEQLVDGGFVPDVADYLIDRLLSKGYLYEAEGKLWLTDGL